LVCEFFLDFAARTFEKRSRLLGEALIILKANFFGAGSSAAFNLIEQAWACAIGVNMI